MKKRIAITGAFGYTGKYITRNLLESGHDIISLTGHPNRPNPFNRSIQTFPFEFDNPDKLVNNLEGVDTLFNTYWIRFSHKNLTFNDAVNNTKLLFLAAKKAGVRRVVHVSITNPIESSELPYFRGKAILEVELQNSGLSYAILRPTVIFGNEDILINNIAYLLRKFPLFTIPGSGKYKLQPIFVEDLAEIAISAAEKEDNLIIDAVGPEIYTFRTLLETIKTAIGSKCLLVSTSPRLALTLSRVFGLFVNDVVLTNDEVRGLMQNLLISENPATGKSSLNSWLLENAETVGAKYSSELKRHF